MRTDPARGSGVLQLASMAQAPAAPAAPDIDVETDREVRLDELPVAETELEPPYRIIIHNKDVTNPI